MPLIVECLSHTPLRGYVDPDSRITREVDDHLAVARERVRTFDPELVVVFAPDHYNGFFYDLMPSFCIGAAATSVGDFRSLAGTLDVPRSTAEALAQRLLSSDFDAALSYRMLVDHGCAQALEVLTGTLDRYPTIPIFLNSVAPPLAPLRRIRQVGTAVGEFLRGLDRRILVIGSGGISHEPPVPELAGADEVVAERLIAGRFPTPASRAARQERTIAAARTFSQGESRLHPLNPDWDRRVMSLLAEARFAEIEAWTNDEVTREGGKSAHEIRTWIAAFAALSASGPYRASVDFYRPIPEWIAGFGAMHGQ